MKCNIFGALSSIQTKPTTVEQLENLDKVIVIYFSKYSCKPSVVYDWSFIFNHWKTNLSYSLGNKRPGGISSQKPTSAKGRSAQCLRFALMSDWLVLGLLPGSHVSFCSCGSAGCCSTRLPSTCWRLWLCTCCTYLSNGCWGWPWLCLSSYTLCCECSLWRKVAVRVFNAL